MCAVSLVVGGLAVCAAGLAESISLRRQSRAAQCGSLDPRQQKFRWLGKFQSAPPFFGPRPSLKFL
jgi:hypothetical protein